MAADRPASYLVQSQLADVPGLVSFWRFNQSESGYTAQEGEPYRLAAMAGELRAVREKGGPFGGDAVELQEGHWLAIARGDCPRLDFHGPEGRFTVVAWIRRARKSNRECEFIAGMWNESHFGRQYGLFLNIGV